MAASNYIAAGRAATQNFLNTVSAARDNSPKYDRFGIQQVLDDAKLKKEKMKADYRVADAGIQAERAIRETKIAIDRDKSIAKSRGMVRKAGVVSAASALVGEALMPVREPFQPDWSLQQEVIDKQQARLEKYAEKLNDPNLGLTPPVAPVEPDFSGIVTPQSSAIPPAVTPSNVKPTTTSSLNLTPAQSTGLAAIRRVESDAYGGYTAYNLGGITEFDPVASGNSADGKQFGRPLTQMTIGEIRQLGNAGKIHATGAYQFTHNTGSFGEAVNFAGLSDSDLFTPENQDKMALAFGRRYGWDRWSGLKLDSVARDQAIAGFR